MLKLRRRGLELSKQFTGQIGAFRQQRGRYMTVKYNTGTGRAACDC